MDPSEMEALVARLIANPHDEEALAYAHQAGATDPKSYATMLERVGNETSDPAYASHWLSEAANVWITTLGDAHRGARVLMTAIEKDPIAAGRGTGVLAQLYREKGDAKALAALLDRRTRALASSPPRTPTFASSSAHDARARSSASCGRSRRSRSRARPSTITSAPPSSTHKTRLPSFPGSRAA